ncbi:metallophosphoesterase family protein [Oxynema sp. CENA135]|nr:metallophosphoesterase family protein [Oxynema sp. CENA135]
MLIPTPESFQIPSHSLRRLRVFVLLFWLSLFLIAVLALAIPMAFPPQLLSDPFLQLPEDNAIRVVWFTEFPGSTHSVSYGENLTHTVGATTTKLSRTREDARSRVGNQTQDSQIYSQPTPRQIWRHEAKLLDLQPGKRIPYRVTSTREDGRSVSSDIFSLTAAPTPGTPTKILLTSDHQLMPMTAANLQKVVETVGRVDAVFLAGDLVNIPDRASEWFDDNRGGAFFPNLQGRGHYQLEKNNTKTLYKGGKIIQYAPLFTAAGNHEVMGRFSETKSLNEQFDNSFPREIAAEFYREQAEQLNPKGDLAFRDRWIFDNSFNTETYREIFSFPETGNGENYYAVTFGDIRLVVLYITNMWRSPRLSANTKGRYREREQDLDKPENWGHGQHLFEPIHKGSPQYRWLQTELDSDAFKQAKYKIVMFHHPPHSLGGNVVPPYTDPVRRFDTDAIGRITVRYEYPREKDYLIRDLMPLLETAGVQLVFFGHSHLWNRFKSPGGIHFLESSNVGNSYGAYWGEQRREVPDNYREDYAATGDPNGLEPIAPTIAPLLDERGQAQPYIASNDLTVFSILETDKGVVRSYYFDTREPESEVVKFDEFKLGRF